MNALFISVEVKQTGIYSIAPLPPNLSPALIPLLSDIFRQTQGYRRAESSNELIIHAGEVVWLKTDEYKLT